MLPAEVIVRGLVVVQDKTKSVAVVVVVAEAGGRGVTRARKAWNAETKSVS